MSRRIFIGVAADNIQGTERLRALDPEVRAIKKALDSIYSELEVVEKLDFEKLADSFRHYADTLEVFHFAGHASSLGLLMQDAAGHPVMPHIPTLTDFLAAHKNLKLVFLNACATREQAKALHEAGIPYVIATETAIYDEVAQMFAEIFYRHFITLGNDPDAIEKAFEKARVEVALKKNKQPGNFRGLVLEGLEGVGEPWIIFKRSQASSTPERKIPEFYLKVDREVPFSDLRLLEGEPITKPKICFVTGDFESRHESLVRRFGIDLLEREKPIQPFGFANETHQPIPWPGNGSWKLLMKDIFETFRIPQTEQTANAQAIVKKIPENTCWYCQVNINFKEDLWQKHPHLETLQRFVNEFWSVHTPSADRQLFVFLHFVFPEENAGGKGFSGFFSGIFSGKKFTSKELLDELNKLKSPNRSLIDISDLVPCSDIHQKILEASRKYHNFSLDDFNPFFRKDEKYPMLRVEENIIQVLKNKFDGI